jgi:cytochrome c556
MGLRRWMGVAITVILIPLVALAHEGATGMVKERMDAMEAMGRELIAIRRSIDANRNLASIVQRAETIQRTGERITQLFPPNSLNPPTAAKPAIWQEWDRFQSLAGQLREASGALASAAKTGDPNAVSARYRDLVRACLSCHQDFTSTR